MSRLPKSRLKKLIALFIIFALAGTGWYWYGSAAQKPQHESIRPIIVTRANIEEVVTSQGKVEPKEYVDVGVQVSGQLKKIYVNIGDAVAQGELLAEIDPRVYQAQVEAGEAKLKSLRAQLNQQKAEALLAEANLQRNRDLIAVNAVSQQALQETESQAAVEKAQVDSILAQLQETESNLKASRANLGFTKIYAPMNGTVTTQPAKQGQTLNANQTAPTVMQVAKLDVMTVRAQVAEADIGRIKVDMPAYFITLGNNEKRWSGSVRQILPTPQVVNDVVLYDVLIDVKNESRQLMSGMTTQVFFIFGQAENALVVPAEILTRRVAEKDNDQGKAFRVDMVTEEGSQPRVIHIGLLTRTQAQVTAGLEEGDRLAVQRSAAGGTAGGQQNQGRGGANSGNAARRMVPGPAL